MPKTFYIIWFSTRLTLSVTDEVYYINVALSLYGLNVYDFISLITLFFLLFLSGCFCNECVLHTPLLNAVNRVTFIIWYTQPAKRTFICRDNINGYIIYCISLFNAYDSSNIRQSNIHKEKS